MANTPLFNGNYPFEPEPAPDAREPYPEIEKCGRCGSNTPFEWDEVEGWVTPCCGAAPINPDVELEDR